MASEVKVLLSYDDSFMDKFKKDLQNTIAGIGNSPSVKKMEKSVESIEIQKVKLAREELKLEVARKKEAERQLKIEEKKTKETKKQMGFFDKMLKNMGFQGNARGEIIRGGFRQLGVGVVNAVGEGISNISGGLISGAGAIGGASIGAMIGSVVPVLGTILGGAIGGAIGGIGTTLISNATKDTAEHYKKIKEYLVDIMPRGSIQAQIEQFNRASSYQNKKNQLILSSGFTMSEKEAGRFVATGESLGLDINSFYANALRLAKNKKSGYFGLNPSEIMGRIITGLFSNKSSKEDRMKVFKQLELDPNMKNFLNSVGNIGLFRKGIEEGGLQYADKYYLEKQIDEEKLKNELNKSLQDDITTSLDYLANDVKNVSNNIQKFIDYGNAQIAIVDATTTSFKSMNKETETFIEIINKLNNTVGSGNTGASDKQKETSTFDKIYYNALNFIKK